MRFLAAPLLALALAACSASPTDAGSELEQIAAYGQCARPAPLHGSPDPRVAGQYIVAFRDGTDAARVTARLVHRYGFQPRFVYEHALPGFAATLTDPQLAGIRCEPETRYVEHDGGVTIGG